MAFSRSDVTDGKSPQFCTSAAADHASLAAAGRTMRRPTNLPLQCETTHINSLPAALLIDRGSLVVRYEKQAGCSDRRQRSRRGGVCSNRDRVRGAVRFGIIPRRDPRHGARYCSSHSSINCHRVLRHKAAEGQIATPRCARGDRAEALEWRRDRCLDLFGSGRRHAGLIARRKSATCLRDRPFALRPRSFP
jgi:hypothetical protein